MDLFKTLYEQFGAPYPRLSLAIAATLGAVIFGGAWWLIGKQYQKEQQKSVVPQVASVATPPLQPAVSAKAIARPLPSDKINAPASGAETAAEHYRKTSITLKKEEIRKTYKELCDRIADRFGLKGWSPVNQLTRMIDTNLGDVEAFERAEKELPASALVALRVLVAFETPKERPMYMSYAFIGRTANGEEVVASFNEAREWAIHSTSAGGRVNHEELLTNLVKGDLERLSQKIEPDIRRLK